MSGLEEYLINGDDLTAAQQDRMGQAVLRVIQRDAARSSSDLWQNSLTTPTLPSGGPAK